MFKLIDAVLHEESTQKPEEKFIRVFNSGIYFNAAFIRTLKEWDDRFSSEYDPAGIVITYRCKIYKDDVTGIVRIVFSETDTDNAYRFNIHSSCHRQSYIYIPSKHNDFFVEQLGRKRLFFKDSLIENGRITHIDFKAE